MPWKSWRGTSQHNFGTDVTTNLTLYGKEKIVRTATVSLEGWTYGDGISESGATRPKNPVVVVKEGNSTVEDTTYTLRLVEQMEPTVPTVLIFR